jgi:hypothetical protein
VRLLALCLFAAPLTAGASPPDPITPQCEQLVDAFWRAVQPALPLLELTREHDLEKQYKSSSAADGIRRVCRALSEEKRRCLTNARDPLASIEDCGADPYDLRPVDLVALSPIARLRKLSTDEQHRALQRLVGRWISDRDAITLEVDAAGRVQSSVTFYGRNRFRAVLDYPGLMALYDGAKFIEVLAYGLGDSHTLYWCVNHAYQHGVRVGGDDRWVARNGDDVLRFDGGRCTAVTRYGQVLPAECAVETEAGRSVLHYSYPRASWPVKDAQRLLVPGQLVNLSCPELRRP